MRIKVQLREDWTPEDSKESFAKGAILDLEKNEALTLIGDDKADRYREPVEPDKAKGADDPDAWKKTVKETVQAAFDDAAKEARQSAKVIPAGDGHTVKVHERVEDDPKLGYKHAGEFYKDIFKVGRDRDYDRAPKLKSVSGMSEGLDSEGGFLVPIEFRNQLLEKMHAASQIASRCWNLPMQGNTIEIPYINESNRGATYRGGGVRVYRLAEGAHYTTTKTSFGKLALRLKKLGGLAHVTDELNDDNSISVAAILERLIGTEMAWVTDNEILFGAGGSEMVGVHTAPCQVAVAKQTGQAADTIVTENIDNMWAQLWAPSRGNAVWLINQECLPQLVALERSSGTSSTLVYTPPGGVSQAPYGTIYGRPVLEIEQMKTLGDAGDIMLCDFSHYVYATKGGLKASQSIHLRFDYDETVLKFVLRNDGAPWWSNYLTPASGSTKYLSPFISLAERA